MSPFRVWWRYILPLILIAVGVFEGVRLSFWLMTYADDGAVIGGAVLLSLVATLSALALRLVFKPKAPIAEQEK